MALSYLLMFKVVIAICLNSFMQHLTVRMLREMVAAQLPPEADPTNKRLILKELSFHVERRIKGAFVKYFIVLTATPSRIKLLQKSLALAPFEIPNDSNWFVYVLKNFIFELNTNISAF